MSDNEYQRLAETIDIIAFIRGGNGVVVSPHWILTAAHVADRYSVFHEPIVVNDQGMEVTHVATPAGGGRDLETGRYVASGDIALMRTKEPIVGVTPAQVNRSREEFGMTVTFVGDGLPGTGLEGPAYDGNRILRAAHNIVSAVGDRALEFVFDSPESGNALDLEGISGPGDSGGPALVALPEGGFSVLGVSSTNSGRGPTLCRYGTVETYARVSAYADWIAKILEAPPDAAHAIAQPVPATRELAAGTPAGRAFFDYVDLINGVGSPNEFFENYIRSDEAGDQQHSQREQFLHEIERDRKNCGTMRPVSMVMPSSHRIIARVFFSAMSEHRILSIAVGAGDQPILTEIRIELAAEP